MTTRQALRQYQTEMTEGAINTADPHRLIQMLLEGALKNIAKAKSLINQTEHTNVANKGSAISTAISIVGCLQASLDMNTNGDIANNLNKLYDYIQVRLVEANLQNDPAILDEVTSLLLEIKAGWDGIREQAVAMFAEAAAAEQQKIADQ